MAKIVKLRGPIREFTVAVEAYSRGGGLLIICSSRVGAYSRGGGNSRIYGFYHLLCMHARCQSGLYYVQSQGVPQTSVSAESDSDSDSRSRVG